MNITLGVTVYTKPYCKQCERMKRRLAALNVPYVTEEIDADVLAWAKTEGIRQAPIITVKTNNTEYIGSGYDEYGINFAAEHYGDSDDE